MTGLWSGFLELFQIGLFALTNFYGGQLGAAILSFSLLARLALLPWSVRISLAMRAHQRKLLALKPSLDAARERWKESPEELAKQTLEIYRKADVSPIAVGPMKASLMQSPIVIGLYSAVQAATNGVVGRRSFWWITDLARPDMGVAALASLLMGLSAWLGLTDPQRPWFAALPAVAVGVIAMMFSAGFGLYMLASGAVGTLQALIVRRLDEGAAA